MAEAKQIASSADVCVIYTGLTDKDDSEGKDRKHMRLPEQQCDLINEIAASGAKVVVVLMNGSAVEMPWLEKVGGVVEAYLGGQGIGRALAEVLFGHANPNGKLAETFPVRLQDTPCYLNFPGERDKVEYREGLFVGYRYYDKAEVKPLFPFGYGLSYTNFTYSDIQLDKKEMNDNETLSVSVKVKNTGNRAGKETAQVYVRDTTDTVNRPDKELKGFEKVSLLPGEEKTVTFKLSKRSFAFYDADICDWRAASGDFEILVGKSSAEIVLSATVAVKSTTPVKKHFTLDSTLFDVKFEPVMTEMIQEMEARFGGTNAVGMDIDAMLSSMKLRSLVPMSSFMQSEGKSAMTMEQLKEMVNAMNA